MKKLFLVLLLLGVTYSPALMAEEAKKAEEKPAVEKSQDGDEEDATPAEETAKADEKKEDDKSFRYAPDFCDFEVTLPEAPTTMKKCIPDSGCFDVSSYIMVYDLRTTVDISVSCNPSTPGAYDKYSEPVMKAALSGMIENKGLTNHEVRFEELEKGKIKSAALTGGGITGRQEKIYTAQLWIGRNSVFTIQAELIGGEHPDADTSFRDILASIKSKEGKQVPRPKKTVLPKQNNQ